MTKDKKKRLLEKDSPRILFLENQIWICNLNQFDSIYKLNATYIGFIILTFNPYLACIIEGSLNSKLPTIWTVEKQMTQAVKSEGRRCTSAKVRRKKIHLREMLEQSRNAVFFQ